MMTMRVQRRAQLQLAVLHFRLRSAPRELDAVLAQHLHGFRTKAITGPGEADGLGHLHLGKFVVDEREFGGQRGGAARCGDVGVGPRMVADLKAHRVQLGDVLPGHEVSGVLHPAMGDEECGVEAEVLEVRTDKGSMRLDGVVEGEDDRFFREGLPGGGSRGQQLG